MSSTQLLAAPQGHSSRQDTALQVALLCAAVENFADGLVIIAKTGEVLHKNRCAQRLLKLLGPSYQTLKTLPQTVWRICQSLLAAEETFADISQTRIVMEDEIQIPHQGRIRVRVQWFNAEAQDCFLVLLEDCAQSAECYATAEAQRYGLTQREAEVWQLRRANFSYKEIAAELYISENTVKKHLKNVYAKREQSTGW